MGKTEYRPSIEEEALFNEGTNCCECNENYEEEIADLIHFILRELCEVEKDVDRIEKAFIKLAKILVDEACLDEDETQAICTVAKDLKLLDCLVTKTIRDMKCLRKVIL
ncbi:hypothetical protein NNC19_05320 [Clostridium sp. SHJSY1]|uniref:hypothetical protein n=1 Tax=Clostridium sp. SHJSY1 TaxID=2942483 RepID=UPI0028758F94|nr:hypothetical protein [Clostridium sp. SHJSY1]MDS0525093.1 hypothetical protein [Clostridium sp. SHJSY1]